jgi:DNA repair exonuclease SbcCD ATPase subunit
MTLHTLRAATPELRQRRAAALAALKTCRDDLDAARTHYGASSEALAVAQSASQHIQTLAHDRIASLVSKCLKAVFGDAAYEFRILFDKKRGRTEARLVFARNGAEIDPTAAAGGGAVDVAAFALRLSCLMLHRPPLRKLLVLDEPFRCLSEDYKPAARALLERLSAELGVQFVIVTHDKEFKIGTVVEVRK